MFIVSLTYKKSLAEVEKHIEAHIAYLKKYYALEKFIASGRKVPRSGGVILANTCDREELDKILQEDPFNCAAIADYEVIEFLPTMVAGGFEKLKDFV